MVIVRALAVVFALAWVVMLGGCSDDGDGTAASEKTTTTAPAPPPTTEPEDESAPPPEDPVEGEWRLAATIQGGERLPARGETLITIAGETMEGADACGNGLRTRLANGNVTAPGPHTLIGCEANDEASHFWSVLEWQGQGPSYELRDGELWLLGADGGGLVFARL